MFISQVNSTNDWLKQHPDTDNVWTTWQTAGRGQAGNSWESEAGKNVLMSLRIRQPEVIVEQQFRITMAISLAVREVVAKLLPTQQVTIKWPNDIFVGDKKICGILIENTIVEGQIAESIVGIGLNVNQTKWYSEASNPISIKQIIGIDIDLQTVFNALIQYIYKKVSLLSDLERLKNEYLSVLYRVGQKAYFVQREVNLMPSKILKELPKGAFEATITDITEHGELVLVTQTERLAFHFKQIQFII